MADLTILGRVSSINVRKVMWTADLIGLAYETETWGLPHRDPREAEFLKLNPNAQVPVILEAGFVLWESGAIMRYLAERHRAGLFPADLRERALVDQWMTWQATELNLPWMYAVLALLRRNPAYADPERIADSIARWTIEMRILEGHLAQAGRFVANDRLSLADIALALATHRWASTPFDKPALPAVMAHYRMLQATAEGEKYMGERTP
ncbi:MAG: glutathione S-transferase family protein [Devosia sp.]|nr:glutathione S-transferase family protein [Devosia sp.]